MTNIRTMRHVVLVALFFAAFCAYGQQKFALVIGNADYQNLGKLRNPANDAADMKTALEALGFQVELILNGGLEQMEDGVIRLGRRLSGSSGAYGFFFYAGHGVQSNGDNFLIPADANIRSESMLKTRSLVVQQVLDELATAGNALNIVVLDACRDNPFSWARSGTRGLSVIGAPPPSSLIVYATSAGSTAADGEGRNGLYTSHLLNNLRTPGLEVREVFRRTASDVARVSGNLQRPALYDQFYDTAYLAASTTERPLPSDMVRIQGGTFTMGSPASEVDRQSNEVQHQVTVGSFYMSKYELTVGEFRQFVNATGYKTTAETSGGGYVWTGSDWEMKADASWKNPYFSQQDNQPVVLVSWYDAVNYCNWRSQEDNLTPAYTVSGTNVTWTRSATGYRLPTEAEWEYACRAGTTTLYSSGSSVDGAGWYSNNSGSKTHPVGTKQANGWGLYDMHGNAWEWCWDWYGAYGTAAQTDPLGASSGTYRVLRGGGWTSDGQYLRSAYRNYYTPSGRDNNIGFRLLRPSL